MPRDKLLDALLTNPDTSRVLCIAVATTARKKNEPVDAKELMLAFGRLVRNLDRRAFYGECRKLQRLGPAAYLEAAFAALRKET